MLIFDQKSSGNSKIAQKMDSPRRFSKSTVIPLQTHRHFRKITVIPLIFVEIHSEPFKEFHVPTGALRKSHNSLYVGSFSDGGGSVEFQNLTEFWKSKFLKFLQIST